MGDFLSVLAKRPEYLTALAAYANPKDEQGYESSLTLLHATDVPEQWRLQFKLCGRMIVAIQIYVGNFALYCELLHSSAGPEPPVE